MNVLWRKLVLLIAFFVVADIPCARQCATAQNILSHSLNSAFRDMAQVKLDAEAGDASAQCTLANSLGSSYKSAEALQWYSKAAAQGRLDAFYQVGHMLLFGALGVPLAQGVAPKPEQGVQIVFRAATNRHVAAYYDLHRAYRDGLGVEKDMVRAYAWLQLDVESSPGLVSGRRAELNNLAMAVDVPTITAGRQEAARYKAGKWPVLVTKAPTVPKQVTPAAKGAAPPAKLPPPVAKPQVQVELKLNGIALGKNPVATINGKTVAVGETARVPAKPNPVALKCLSVEERGVSVMVEGEDGPRLLRMR
jgi:hypothetical protein